MVKETAADILGALATLVCTSFAAYWLLAL
jgi:hypothetical protein